MILFVGAHYEIKNGSEITKYYLAGTQRVAMRKYTIPQNMIVEYLFSDQLGSTSLTTDTNGAKILELRYKAWGEVRASWTSSPSTTPAYKTPSYTFTGQFSYMDDPTTTGTTEGFGLMFYRAASRRDNARWYDPAIGRFAQADSIVPGGVQGMDRYAYSDNNPVRYTDPSGHYRTEGDLPDYKPYRPYGLTSTGDGACQRRGNSYCDGARLYEVYLWYKRQTSGWWYTNGQFTPWDFFAMILMFEANGNQEDLKAIMVAAGNQLWGTSSDRAAYCESQSCMAGLFNFIGAYMESGVRRWNSLYDSNFNPSPGTYAGLTAQPSGGYDLLVAGGLSLPEVANELKGQTFRSVGPDDPTDWGVPGDDPDLKWFAKAWKYKAPYGTTDRCGVYYMGYDVVYTQNQAYNWSGGYCIP